MYSVGRPAILTHLSRITYPLDLLLRLVVTWGTRTGEGACVKAHRIELCLGINVMTDGRRNDEPLAQTTLAKRKLPKLCCTYVAPAGGVIELSELLGRLRAAIGGTQSMHLSSRTLRLLGYSAEPHPDQIAKMSESAILNMPGIGRKTLNEIKEWLHHNGINNLAREPKPTPQPIHPRIPEIMKLREEGHTMKKIAAQVGLSVGRCSNLVQLARNSKMSDLSELINEALSHLDDDMARINAWKAVPSERLHGWTIDAATENYLRFFKPLELDKRHVVMLRVPEELTVPIEDAIIFAAYKLLAFEKEISTSH